ncbi:hypothetical protein [Emticicia sp. TH156]|uniref:hypothetical protein n=1 Tax=Emticicia sp. TH156 TaxID=2067454 RepID=UPI000C78D63D|nr:hypothetical protein [Emticicia sp. TH156]PLK45514.1 hypothetical protein C0V77_05090 [Emticicia sp. TH156]
MKNIKVLVFTMLAATAVFMTGCYEEPDLIGDITTSKGKVAQISVVWLGTTRTTTANTSVVANQTTTPGANTNFNIEYTTQVPVKEFRVYWAATATGTQTLLTTIPAGSQKYDATLRSYVLAIPITAQTTAKTSRVFFAEIVTDNGLLSAQKSATLTTN